MKKIKIKIDGKIYVGSETDTVMSLAHANGIEIPSFCHHPDFAPKGNCRICVVELKGSSKLMTSCSLKLRDGMEVFTDTPKVREARNINIELLFAEHIEKCSECIWSPTCKLLNYADCYKVNPIQFTERKAKRKTYKFANAVEIDGTQCIDCRNCIDACAMQGINYLELKGKGIHQEIIATSNKKIDCIYCGQCAVHCPVSAAQEQSNWDKVETLLHKKNKVMVAQFAPSIRVSIGEEFGLPYGQVMTGQMVTALKRLGFDYVFDVNFGADMTTVVEAEELVGRIVNKGVMPMFTSCCPAWVKYVEFYRPDLIPNLTTARSPQIHIGGTIKSYWAKKMGIRLSDIVVVSVMPCTAKKFESTRTEMFIRGNAPVDHVITTREFVWLMKRNNIDFPSLENTKADDPLGEYSGAAAIYGATGGVMESALRSANYILCHDKKSSSCPARIEYKSVRGMAGVKSAQVAIGNIKVRVAVVNGIGNIKSVLDNLDKFDYIEVMSCPGGCIGGGGQPVPTNDEIRKKRTDALYKLDKGKKSRLAHENKSVREALAWMKEQGHSVEHSILHTKYKKRKR